jgi:hypothetical protein
LTYAAGAMWSPTHRSRGLSFGQRRVLRAVAETVFWDGTRPVPPGRLDTLMADFDDYVRTVAGATRAVLGLSMLVLQLSPLLVLRRPRRLTSLPVERRLVCLQRLDRSRFAVLSLLLGVAKIMLAMLYFEQPEVLAETGYDGSCLVGSSTSAGLPLPPPMVASGPEAAA